MMPVMGLLRASALVLGMAFVALVAGQSAPESKISSFDNLPMRLFFLDDTKTAIYHDRIEGNVYVSLDEGRTWKEAHGIPSGVVELVIDHPFDNRYAFALTDGETHYRTEDKGETWRPFKVPAPPASVARPLVFHSDPKKYGYILYQGTNCERSGWGAVCRDETYYTKSAFSDDAELLLSDTTNCQFAHSSKDFKHAAHEDLIYCVAFDASGNNRRPDLSSSKLFSSTDFFKDNKRKLEDLGIGKKAKGVIAFAIVSRYAVVALKDDTKGGNGEMTLYVTFDTKTWAKAQFPHASSAKLRENAYTMLESTTHSLAVDVVLQDNGSVGTLFISNSNGTYFVESLKDTNRNDAGYVDYERLYGVEGIGLANIVMNAGEVDGRRAAKKLRTMITFNDGSSWRPVRAPERDAKGDKIKCDVSDLENCSLHFHSVTAPHNFGRIFSSPAPGFVMGVGSVGSYLRKYDESDTFLSTDGGLTWKMVAKDAHKYEFGDVGSILVIVNDEEHTDEIKYSLDLGKTWKKYDIGIKLRAKALVTLPDSTSQKFLLLGTVTKQEQKKHDVGSSVIVYLDFVKTRGRKCGEDDFEKWYAREGEDSSTSCLMGHRQWYKRRKPDAECYVGEKYRDPVTHEDPCKCTDADFECDYNYIRNGKECVPVGPEPIPAGVCADPNETYMGSSGFRKIPGNTCEGGIDKAEKVKKKCSQAQPKEGEIIHQTFEFPAAIVQHAYFKDSKTILVRLEDLTVWQSSNEGYTWQQLFSDHKFLAFYHHKHTSDRAFLITDTDRFFYTTTTGRSWEPAKAPSPPNTFGAQVLRFHPKNSDLIIWVGNKDCHGGADGANCHAEAHYSRDNGRNWDFVESYVRNCAFAVDSQLNADPTEILCESLRSKKGNQKFAGADNPLELVTGTNFYRSKRKMFDSVVGFAKFSEYLVVAEMLMDTRTLKIQVSLDGTHFATGQFPPTMSPETHAYTILESNTKSLFLHMTTSEAPNPYWGAILKSNSNGTYFGLSLDHVNRNEAGYIDFEKMIGLDGIALVNVVSNPQEAIHSRVKKIQSRITHNDGGSWKPLTPPRVDSQGQEYECQSTKCALHVHGYTERIDPRATYSSPSVVGLLMAVGNVGESLAPYTESDTFLSRDGGFTWFEIHKDAHLWEFGDSGSILIIANDEEPTDYVTFSTDEGLTWREYTFSDVKMKVMTIVTVPSDTSRRFILFGYHMRSRKAVAVHLDFSMLTTRQCTINVEDPGNDDFELWSPSENREELCLFGRQTLYHRRTRQANCVVGTQPKAATTIKRNCPCTKADFECEFNYVKDADGECVLVPGTTPLPDDPVAACSNNEDYWYERTAWRMIPYSSCEDGYRPDRGAEHVCPGFKSKGAWFWLFMLLLPFGFTALVGYYYWRKSGMARGTIRLPGEATRYSPSSGSGALATLASVPWFIIGVAGIAYEWVASRVEDRFFSARRGYRNVPIDEDAQILRFEDEE